MLKLWHFSSNLPNSAHFFIIKKVAEETILTPSVPQTSTHTENLRCPESQQLQVSEGFDDCAEKWKVCSPHREAQPSLTTPDAAFNEEVHSPQFPLSLKQYERVKGALSGGARRERLLGVSIPLAAGVQMVRQVGGLNHCNITVPFTGNNVKLIQTRNAQRNPRQQGISTETSLPFFNRPPTGSHVAGVSFPGSLCATRQARSVPSAVEERDTETLATAETAPPLSISNSPKAICHFPRRGHDNRNKEKDSLPPACHKQPHAEKEMLIFPR